MKNKPLSLRALSETDAGFSVVACPTLLFTMRSVVLTHISQIFDQSFDGSFEAAAHYCAGEGFGRIKEKMARLLPLDLVNEAKLALTDHGFLSSCRATSEFITDEEGLGYENLYWRLVRPNQLSDVGPVHADYWFWDLGHGTIDSSFVRVKTWMPLMQGEGEPGLLVLPGSHTSTFEFDSWVDLAGKRKPRPKDRDLQDRLSPAPIRCGEAIVFHDRLLHGGRTTSGLRLSVEWTTALAAHP
jgi:hypothetical protein